jgi:hypothetical protein
MRYTEQQGPYYREPLSRRAPRLSKGISALVVLISLAACSATGGDRVAASTAAETAAQQPSRAATQDMPTQAGVAGVFEGVWQACEGATAPEECNRYVLLQRGDRICGTWAYFASGDGYEGHVVAQVTSPTEARRIKVCGRPGSEARTECDQGWDRIDKPLHICGGKLGDLNSANGECVADFERVVSPDVLTAIAQEPWVKACLSGGEPEIAR